MDMDDKSSKLDELSDRIDKMLDEQGGETFKKTKDKDGIGYGLSMATQILSAIIVGASVGIFLDKIFTNSHIFFIIFLFFGIVAGFLNCYRLEKKYNKDN